MKKILMISCSVVLGMILLMNCSKLPDEGLIEKGKNYEAEEKFSEAIKNYEKLVKKLSIVQDLFIHKDFRILIRPFPHIGE